MLYGYRPDDRARPHCLPGRWETSSRLASVGHGSLKGRLVLRTRFIIYPGRSLWTLQLVVMYFMRVEVHVLSYNQITIYQSPDNVAHRILSRRSASAIPKQSGSLNCGDLATGGGMVAAQGCD